MIEKFVKCIDDGNLLMVGDSLVNQGSSYLRSRYKA